MHKHDIVGDEALVQPVARTLARELSPEEVAMVAAGACGGASQGCTGSWVGSTNLNDRDRPE